MNLTQYATSNNIALTKPEHNLLAKLETKYGLVVNPADTSAANPLTGLQVNTSPLVSALVKFVTRSYASYSTSFGRMSYRGIPVAIGTYDRTRYLVLKLDKSAYSDVLD